MLEEIINEFIDSQNVNPITGFLNDELESVYNEETEIFDIVTQTWVTLNL